MDFSFFSEFHDDYLRDPGGQGVFLAGVVLGYIARHQVGSDRDIKNAPLFKQIHFGRMDMRQLKRLLARVPQYLASYADYVLAGSLVASLSNEAGLRLLSGRSNDLGVDGNFAFAVGFGNATSYFWKIFKQDREVDLHVIQK